MTDDEKKDFNNALHYAYFFLKFRPRSVYEVTSYLQKKSKKRKWSQNAIPLVIQRLEDEKLIDDAAFTQWFVSQRISGKPKGEYVLRQELLRFRVPERFLNEYFLTHPPDETALARRILVKRWLRLKDLPHEERTRKAYGFLSRRGFQFDVIKKTIAEMEEK